MSAAIYVTQQAVLEEAGLWQRQTDETPAGVVDGSNSSFSALHKPLSDNNYDGTVTEEDVVAYVNGSVVTVTAVDAPSGSIVLAVAPDVDDRVTVDYAHASVSLDYVAGIIEEAQEWVDQEMAQVVQTPYTEGAVPFTIRKITRVYAAGLAVLRYFGMQITDDQSKLADGKIKLAERWLTAYRARMESNGHDAGEDGLPSVSNEGNLFQRHDPTSGEWGPLPDDNFRVRHEEY